MHRQSLSFLKRNWEVLLMDCTYKTNRYHMPLLLISGVTATNSSFYVAYCFLAGEDEEDYAWALGQLRKILVDEDICDPKVICTDRDKALLKAVPSCLPSS